MDSQEFTPPPTPKSVFLSDRVARLVGMNTGYLDFRKALWESFVVQAFRFKSRIHVYFIAVSPPPFAHERVLRNVFALEQDPF